MFFKKIKLETQRLYTILPILSREADVDTTVGGIKIKKGTMVLWNTEVIHHNEGFLGYQNFIFR